MGQIGFIVPLKSMLQVKSEMNEKVDSVVLGIHTIKLLQ